MSKHTARLKDMFSKDPKIKAEMKRIGRWGEFWRLNPSLCKHPGIIAPVSEDGKMLSGICLYCDGENVLGGGGFPDGEPFTVTMTSDAQTITTKFAY